jgi:hypothetical protein
VIITRATRRIPRKGREATPKRMMDLSNLKLAMKRFMPIGGVE